MNPNNPMYTSTPYARGTLGFSNNPMNPAQFATAGNQQRLGPYFNFSLPEPTGVVAVIAPQASSLLGFVSVDDRPSILTPLHACYAIESQINSTSRQGQIWTPIGGSMLRAAGHMSRSCRLTGSLFQARQQRSDLSVEAVALIGQRYRARRPIEQAHADTCLQSSYSAAYAGWR